MRGKNKEFQTNELYCTLQYLHRGSPVYSSRFKPISNNKLHCKEMLRATREKFPNFTILAVMNFWQLENKEFTKNYDIYQHTHHFEISEVLDLPFLNFLV
jgi:hypothetical protein